MTNTSTTSIDLRSSTPRRRRQFLDSILAMAGITVNGNAPWDIQIYDERLYNRVGANGSLGAGEAYMDGMWDVERLDEFFYKLLKAGIDQKVYAHNKLMLLLNVMRCRILNLQSRSRAWLVGEQHYDIGNELFETMLDSTMSYSCAYWQNANSLEQAQQHKLDLICRKLQLQSGETLLDIGCGWGGLVEYAAKHYGVNVTGVTISKEQCKLARQRCKDLPVKILLQDYRDLKGRFDKIVSVGMFEHVGPKNHATYFDIARRLVKNNGLFLLHTIGDYSKQSYADPWIQKYIFPNGKIPSARSIIDAATGWFIIEDWHNFGTDYDRTLMAWWHNFQSAWRTLENNYEKRFYRMWKYYLLSCAGYFRAKHGQLWQIVLSKPESKLTYRSVR